MSSKKSKDNQNQTKTFYTIKIILIGNSGVGKTSLLSRYMNEGFNVNQKCTLNAEFKIKSITINENTSAQITIWDTCGQEKYRSMTGQYFKNAHGILLMFDVGDKRSFTDLNLWLDEIKKHIINEDVTIYLVGNKIDLKRRNISSEDANNFAKNNDLLYCETSSKEGLNVDFPFDNITKEIVEKLLRKSKNEKENRERLALNNPRLVKGKEVTREKEVKCC